MLRLRFQYALYILCREIELDATIDLVGLGFIYSSLEYLRPVEGCGIEAIYHGVYTCRELKVHCNAISSC